MKINLIILFLILFSAGLFAQNQQKQDSNVELPDFVIMGKDVVSVQHEKKIAPDFVSIVSQEYLKPAFSPEELPVSALTNPLKNSSNLTDSLSYTRGNLNAAIGFYSLPVADFNYEHPFNNGLFSGFANGNYQRAYVDNSDRYSLSGGANLAYYVKNDAGFLPGTHFKVHGNYGMSSYKFFASPNPLQKRTFGDGSISIGLNNMWSKVFIFSGEVSDNMSSLKEEPFSENLFDAKGMTKLKLSNLSLEVNVNYKSQSLSNSYFNKNKFHFLAVSPRINLQVSDGLKVAFGINYAKSGADDFMSPTAGIALKVDNGISLYSEYAPNASFFTVGHYLKENNYLTLQNFNNVFFKKQSNFNLIIKYEYFTYFEIDGGFRFFSSHNIPYFRSSSEKGKFDLITTDGKSGTAFINLLFHLGPFGSFYGSANYSDVRDSSSLILPYSPHFKAALAYSYNFNFGLNSEVKLVYNSQSYADLENTKTINPYIDLNLKFLYKMQHNFGVTLEIANILNHDNYEWFGYKAMPLNLKAGINYHW